VEGTSISVTATASSGYRLNTVTIGDVSQSGVSTSQAGSNTFNYTVNAATTISATTVKMYTVSWSAGDGTTVTCNTSGLSNGGWVDNGTTVSFTINLKNNYKDLKVNNTAFAGGNYSVTVNGANVNVKASATYDSCLVEGTMITLANGSQKAIENLTYEDELLVFNHLTGKIEAGQISFIDHADQESSMYKIVNLQFSDGSKLRIISEHGLFDLTENKYVYISADNMLDYIGHTFYATSYNGVEFVQYEVVLTNAYITEEIVKIYSPVTVPHTNCFAESLLTVTPMPNGVRGFMNIFDFDDELKYDETTMKLDIETYGLYTYEDFAEYLTLEEFENSMLKYLKVSVGKGYLTYEDIVSCIFAEFE
jgi:hypothetical protein